MVPHRGLLVLTGSQDRAGLEVMLKLAQSTRENTRSTSGIPVRLNNGVWAPFNPDTHQPDLRGFKSLRVFSVGEDYAAQKRLLDKLHEKRDEGPFVSPFMRLGKENEDFASCCTWTEGVPSLLPRTDIVSLVEFDSCGNPSKATFARWEALSEVVEGLRKPVDGLYPERFLVDQFPTPEQLGAIGYPGEQFKRLIEEIEWN
jgi:hypothetical protein